MVTSLTFLVIGRGDGDEESLSPTLLINELVEMNKNELRGEPPPSIEDYYVVKDKLNKVMYEKQKKIGLAESEKRIEKERKEKERKRQEEIRLAEQKRKEEERLVQLTKEEKIEEDNGTWKTFQVTAYTNNVESTNKSPDHPLYGVTANGERTQEGRSLSCPPEYGFGTEMYIPHFDNTYTCVDRGSAIVGDRLDVYIEDLNRALSFGIRDLDVKILRKE